MENDKLHSGSIITPRYYVGTKNTALRPRPIVVLAMILVGTVLLMFGTIASCTPLSQSQQAHIEQIEGEIVSLVSRVESGDLTLAEAQQIAKRLQAELEALKDSGLNMGEILLGLLGAFIAGALGVPSSGVPGILKKIAGK